MYKMPLYRTIILLLLLVVNDSYGAEVYYQWNRVGSISGGEIYYKVDSAASPRVNQTASGEFTRGDWRMRVETVVPDYSPTGAAHAFPNSYAKSDIESGGVRLLIIYSYKWVDTTRQELVVPLDRLTDKQYGMGRDLHRSYYVFNVSQLNWPTGIPGDADGDGIPDDEDPDDDNDGIPDDLTRVEFQLRRKGLKDIQVMADDGAEPGRIEDVDSYLKVRNNLWRYLACEWFRFTEKPVDRKNKNNSKAKTWSTWEMVQNSVSSACESAKRTRRAVQVNPEHMKKMALGVVMGAAMLERPGEIASAGDLVRYFRDVIIEGGRDYFLEVKEKHSLRYFMRAGNALGNA